MWVRVDDLRKGQKFFIVIMVALIALAWLTLWVWGQDPNYGPLLSHKELGESEVNTPEYLSRLQVFAGGWTLMTVAMMLPISLPLVILFRSVINDRPDSTRLLILLIAGYLSVWTLFGLAAHLGDWGLHKVVEGSVWLQTNSWLVAAATIGLAGLYQFTSLKYVCLAKCRSPRSFIIEHWQGSHEQSQSFRLGVRHGVYCVGCCWTLMLLMFAVGVGNVGWMLGLGVVMAAERNFPWGRRISAPLGVALLGWSVILVLLSGQTSEILVGK